MVSGYGYNPLMDPKLASPGVDLLTRAVRPDLPCLISASLPAPDSNALSHLNSLMVRE